MPHKRLVNKGDRYWKLVIIEEIPQKKNRSFLCKCDCWTTKEVFLWNMIRWLTVSCGCFQLQSASKKFKTHWMAWTRFYKIYIWLLERTEWKRWTVNKLYWWRGIKCEWNSFEEFYKDMYLPYIQHCKLYWELNTSIDRIDVNWNYCKENCRWATAKKQSRNRRNNRIITHKGKTMCLAEWAEYLWLNIHTVRHRLYTKKRPIEKVLWFKD